MSGCMTTASATELLDTPVEECLVLAAGLPPRAVLALKRQLRGLRFNVRVAGALDDALAMLRRHRPGLVLAGGKGAARLFWRARREGLPVACIGLLEQSTPRQVLEMLSAGADECLAWPFPPYMLARRLMEMRSFA